MSVVTRPSVAAVSPDSQLVEAARAGSRKAFAELVERYQDTTFRFAHALTGNATLSEEIAQEAFLIAWRGLPTLQRPERFKSWLGGIVWKVGKRRCQTELSHRPRETWERSIDEGLQSADPSLSPLDRAISHEEVTAALRALAEVPDTYRAAIVLHYVENQSMDEIAEALGLTVENVRQRLSRGRKMLQQRVLDRLQTSGRKLVPRKGFAAGVVAAILADRGMTAPRGHRPLLIAGGATALLVSLLSVGARRPSGSEAAPGPASSAQTAASRTRVTGRGQAPQKAAMAATRAQAYESGPAVPADEPSPLLSLDFESDLPPPTIDAGELVSAGCPGQSRHCVLARPVNGESVVNFTTYLDVGPTGTNFMFGYSPHAVLELDYWAAPDVTSIRLSITIGAKPDRPSARRSFRVAAPTHDAWTHATVRLEDFTGTDGSAGLPDESNTVTGMEFVATRAGEARFYLDNIRVLDLRIVPDPR